MSAFLLYHPKTRTTGRALAKLLGIHSGQRCSKLYEACKTIIRWGNIRDIKATYLNGNGGYSAREEVNKKGSVQLAGSKYRALERLQDKGISVPRFVKRGDNWPDELFELKEGTLVALGRKWRHSRGTDIELLYKTEHGITVAEWDYVTEYIKPHKEYRIHVMNEECILAQRKYFRVELQAALVLGQFGHPTQDNAERMQAFYEECNIIRNNEHGWGFHDMNDTTKMPQRAIQTAIDAVKALGLDFGAVDLISVEKDDDGIRKVFVLEVNTAPGLRDRNLEIYANKLKEII